MPLPLVMQRVQCFGLRFLLVSDETKPGNKAARALRGRWSLWVFSAQWYFPISVPLLPQCRRAFEQVSRDLSHLRPMVERTVSRPGFRFQGGPVKCLGVPSCGTVALREAVGRDLGVPIFPVRKGFLFLRRGVSASSARSTGLQPGQGLVSPLP